LPREAPSMWAVSEEIVLWLGMPRFLENEQGVTS